MALQLGQKLTTLNKMHMTPCDLASAVLVPFTSGCPALPLRGALFCYRRNINQTKLCSLQQHNTRTPAGLNFCSGTLQYTLQMISAICKPQYCFALISSAAQMHANVDTVDYVIWLRLSG